MKIFSIEYIFRLRGVYYFTVKSYLNQWYPQECGIIIIIISLNLKGNPKWNPQTAFRALCTTVQIAAWSPNRTRALIITPVPSWYIPEAGCQNDKLCLFINCYCINSFNDLFFLLYFFLKLFGKIASVLVKLEDYARKKQIVEMENNNINIIVPYPS